MMRLPWFEYRAPRTVAEAAKILAGEGPQAMLVAGGTDLLPNMKRRHQTPKCLISLRQIQDLKSVSNGSGITFGAGLTLSEIVRNERTPTALRQAAAQIATPHLRNMGTLGGNLCLDTRCTYYNQNYEWRQAIDFCLANPLLLLLLPLHSLVDLFHQFARVRGFHEIIVCAQLHPLDRSLDRGVAGKHDDLQNGLDAFHLPERLHTIPAGHEHVKDNHIHIMSTYELDGIVTVETRVHVKTPRLKALGKDFDELFLIVHQKHSDTHFHHLLRLSRAGLSRAQG